MKKRPFLIFAAIVGVLVAGALGFIQSRAFARALKETVAAYLPRDLGIEGDFQELAIRFYPPGLALMKPTVMLREKNALNLPAGSEIRAEEIDLIFRPLQMLSGTIRIREVGVIGGEVKLLLADRASPAAGSEAAREPRKKARFPVTWDDLFRFQADALAVRDTRFQLRWVNSPVSLRFDADSLRFEQARRGGVPGYNVGAVVREIQGEFPRALTRSLRLPPSLRRLELRGHLDEAGLQLDELSLEARGIGIKASGTLEGNVLGSRELVFDAEASAGAELAQVLEDFGSGTVEFKGRVRGNLLKLAETLKADGMLAGRDLRIRGWRADSLQAQWSWSASGSASGAGQLSVSKVTIARAETEKRGSEQGGDGGRISAGPFSLGLPVSKPAEIPLQLERAHLHWLTGPAFEKIFPLSLRASGAVSLVYTPAWAGQPFSVRATLAGLQVDSLELDNQKLGRPRPRHKILSLPNSVRLDGSVLIDSSGILPAGLTLTLPRSKLLASGKVDFKTGYDLVASGGIHLADLGQLAETDISGTGRLQARIHGPAQAVVMDFDADLQDANYLNLRLGDLKGRISYEEDPSLLHFRGIEAAKSRTSYRAEGLIDLGKTERIDLKIDLERGDVRDLMDIFEHQTSSLWWYPRSLAGPLSGSVRLTGAPAMEELVVNARLHGKDWEFYGEKFKSVELVGGYEKGRYFISEGRGQKRSAALSGSVSFDSRDGQMDWQFKADRVALSDVNLLAQLDVPVRGNLRIESSGSGGKKGQPIRSSTLATLSGFSVRGGAMPDSRLSIKSDAGVARMTGDALGGQGTFELAYGFDPSSQSSLKAELRHFDFSPFIMLINPKMAQDPQLAGFASGNIEMKFRAGAIERGTGFIDLREYLLAKSGTRFELAEPLTVKVDDGSFDLGNLVVRGNRGEFACTLSGKKGELRGSLSGDLDLSVAEFFTPAIARASGLASLDISLGGTVKAPQVSGRMNFANSTLQLAELESPFENLNGQAVIRQNVLSFPRIEADLAGGKASAEGKIALFADRVPEIALRGTLTGNKIRVFPFQYAKVRGELSASGNRLPYLVEGSVFVESALSRERVLNQRQAEGLRAIQYTPASSSQRARDLPLFRLNIEAQADENVLVQNDLMDAELKAKVKVVNTLDTPRVVGTAEVLRGRLLFKDHSFQIQSASMEFDSPMQMNPKFTLSSSTEVSGFKIQLFVAGRMDKWKVELSSNPVIPESEILSLLAIGMTSSDSRRFKPEDRSVYEQGEAASLLLNSLDFNREVQSKTGIQIQLEESVATQSGSSVFRPQSSQGDTAVSPKIVVKKRIGDRVEFSYGSTVGIGTNSQQEVNAEVRLTNGISAIGVYDYSETLGTQEKSTAASYGVDFKLQKRFK